MLRKILIPLILLILAFGFWASEEFKVIAAGVAIFLFGMLSLEEGFDAFTGGTLERVLRRMTSNRWNSLGFGLVSTALVQSSSLISVISISFVSAGLITLAAGIGVVFGSNLGTTTGAWLIAGFGLKINIASYAMPMLVFGIILVFQPTRKMKGFGYVLCGLGFLFLGIHYMKEGFDAVSKTIDLARFSMPGYPGVLAFMVVGIVATVVMQSSHATLALTLTALAVSQITYENALALAIGSNVGTTITAILGALSANETGKRLAGAHLIFNFTTAIISIALIYQLMGVVDWLALNLGIANDNYTLKLAIFHSVFNLIGIGVMMPFIQPLVGVLEKVIPDKLPEIDQPKYLSSASAEFADTAFEAVRNETRRIFDAASSIIISVLGIERTPGSSTHSLKTPFDGRPLSDETSIDAMYEKHIKSIYSAIVTFISDTAFSRREEQPAGLQWLRESSTQIVEAVKDTKHLHKNLSRHVVSTNANVRSAYSQLRQDVAGILQDIAEARLEEDGSLATLELDSVKQSIDEQEDKRMEKVTELIAKRRISSTIGSSLLNDSAYARDVCMNLVLAAQTLFGSRQREHLSVARTLSLDDLERGAVTDPVGTANDSGSSARHTNQPRASAGNTRSTSGDP